MRTMSVGGVSIYEKNLPSHSPNGACDKRLCLPSISPEGEVLIAETLQKDLTHVLVLNTDTGQNHSRCVSSFWIGADRTVVDSAAVSSTVGSDDTAASGRELAPLDIEKAVIPGAGGHSQFLLG